ncbi:hypothetical protein J2Y69_003054 [Microbacterium resistens]|uniref:Uncharacterized protein n=1 Tax=Microbacterium resistens TaxID=156977 RepID=A0ABU1SFQ9_9MICO|nr:hypothetical protein [Microbacterium resistens]MDR6868438.1 hypothetical protein [Microbacterium resistens]
MAESGIKAMHYPRTSDNQTIIFLWNELSGFAHEVEGTTAETNNAISQIWGTGPFILGTESWASAIKRDLAKVRTGSA